MFLQATICAVYNIKKLPSKGTVLHHNNIFYFPLCGLLYWVVFPIIIMFSKTLVSKFWFYVKIFNCSWINFCFYGVYYSCNLRVKWGVRHTKGDKSERFNAFTEYNGEAAQIM